MASGRPGEGKIGTNTSTVIHIKKPKGIRCDCSKCKHRKNAAGTIYCTWFDLFNPRKTYCPRFTGNLQSGQPKKKKKKKEKKA